MENFLAWDITFIWVNKVQSVLYIYMISRKLQFTIYIYMYM